MKVTDFNYDLPQGLIAQHPAEKRDMSRMLVLDSGQGKIEHKVFKDIAGMLSPGDCLVINDSRVIPARLFGHRPTGAAVEMVLLHQVKDRKDCWEVIVRPGSKVKPGSTVIFGDGQLTAEVLEVASGGNRIVHFVYQGAFFELLDRIGNIPLPPYIHEKLEEAERYQTVFAREKGSAAAPTAGLHFTEELMDQIKSKGVKFANITLHIGLGTFRPMKTETVEEHIMHAEYFEISPQAAQTINEARRAGGRIIAVGTTSCRTLESVADENGFIFPGGGSTDIFIYPGYKFKAIDALITNFHLPQSTLMLLVSAFAGREHILKAYQNAIDEKYRFFSFGDAMFIV